MHVRLRALAVAALVLAALTSGCDRSGDAAPAPTAAGTAGSGPLTVFAAASLTEAFDATKAALASTAPALDVTYSYAGSQALVQQIIQGAPADVFASADQKTMQTLVEAGLVTAPRTFARNRLEIVVAPGNPKHVTELRDLARPDLVVVLADPSVPVGSYAQRALTTAGVDVKPKSLELDVKATLAKVTSGEADAAIVYHSDVAAAGPKVAGVAIPAGFNVTATYPIAVLKASRHRRAASAFVAEILSRRGQATLRAHGFLPASS
jgi:molybdate transport system substrate-binding protein